MQTHPQHEVNSPPPALPHLTTWQSLCEKCCQEEDHYQGRSPGSKSGQMPKRNCAEFLHETPITDNTPSVCTLMDGPEPSLVPASYLALPLILSSSSGLNPLSLCHSTPLFSSPPLCHEHNHMCTYYTTSQGGCPRSRDRGLVFANRQL